MIVEGKFRVYFNRHGAAPLVWCVAPEAGGWELAVSEVRVYAPMGSIYRPKAEADENDGKPSAWLEATGQLRVQGSIATITAMLVPTVLPPVEWKWNEE